MYTTAYFRQHDNWDGRLNTHATPSGNPTVSEVTGTEETAHNKAHTDIVPKTYSSRQAQRVQLILDSTAQVMSNSAVSSHLLRSRDYRV